MHDDLKTQGIRANTESMAGSLQPVKESAIPRELDMLHEACEALQGALNRLDDRLQPALEPDHPKDSAEDSRREQPCHIATSIYEARLRVESNIRHVTALIGRLHV